MNCFLVLPYIYILRHALRTRPVDKAMGRSRVLGVPTELALLHPIQNALDWYNLGFLCHGCRWKRRVAPFGAACRMEGLESRRPWKRLYCTHNLLKKNRAKKNVYHHLCTRCGSFRRGRGGDRYSQRHS